MDGLPAFANISVLVTNWTTVRPATTNGLAYGGINLGGCAKGEFNHCASLLTANYSTASGSNEFPSFGSFQNAECRGLILPANGNNDHALARACWVSGDAFGFRVGEHAYLENCKVVGASFIAELCGNDSTAAGEHLIKIIGMSAEDCQNGFWILNGGESGVGFFIDAEIDLEGLAGPSSLIRDNDSGGGLSTLFGQIRIYGAYGSYDIFPTPYPTNVKIYAVGGNGGQAPGYVSGYAGFSSAGTGVAVQNPYWRDVAVHFSGGTISAVSQGVTLGGVGGNPATAPSMTATGLSSAGEITWPSGGWLSFTYTGSPTWNVDVPS